MVARRFENSLIPLFCSWTQYFEVFMFSTGHWKVWKDLGLCARKWKEFSNIMDYMYTEKIILLANNMYIYMYVLK